MGFKQLSRKLEGLLSRTEAVEEDLAEPEYRVEVLTDRQLRALSDLLDRFLAPGSELDDQQELVLGWLLQKMDQGEPIPDTRGKFSGPR